MSTENSEILIIAGEVSGDLIGASLIGELKEFNDNLKVFGIGGNKMKAEGFEVIYHIDQLAFLGFAEVVKHIPFIKKVQRTLLEFVEQRKIKHAVLIDYPGFNLSIAKRLKAKGIKIIYYVSPQIWAWGKNRIDKMKSLVDKMLVVFPFEKEFYNKSNIDVEFVGHPLVERVSQYSFLSKEEFYSKFELENNKELLLIMPGSRNQEIKKIFPQCIKAAARLSKNFDLQIVVACSENMDDNVFNNFKNNASFKVIKGYNYDLMNLSKFGIIKSGTSTLEAGYFSLPMVIVYRTSLLSYLIGRQLITLDRIGMVNILLGEKLVPELIQNDVNEKKIFSKSEKILSDKKVYEDYKKGLSVVKEKLGKTGASKKSARIICEFINEEI